MCLHGELSISMIFLCYGIPPSGLAHKNFKSDQWHGYHYFSSVCIGCSCDCYQNFCGARCSINTTPEGASISIAAEHYLGLPAKNGHMSN